MPAISGHERVSVELLETGKERFDIKYLNFLICDVIDNIDRHKVFINKFE